jgi:HSP20 family molecular chaperone IbpA
MSNISAPISVQKVDGEEKASVPVFAEMGKRHNEVRRRAYELFCDREGEVGQELDDWLAAERELFGSAKTAVSEKDNAYQLDITLPGFDAKEVEVTATPAEIIVHAHAERPGGVTNEMYRRIELPKPLALEKVAAKLEKGTLRIIAPQAAAA